VSGAVGRSRLKRRLMRELVAENLQLIRGGTPRRRRRGGGRLLAAARLLAFALVPAVLIAPSYLSSPMSRDGAASANAATAPAAVDAPAAPRSAPARAAAVPVLTLPAGDLPTHVDPAVFPLAVERVAIDPGHGGVSGGTQTPSGLLEKELTLDIAERLRRLLVQASYQVVMTRDADVDVSLEERTQLANRSGADLFVSLHVNWIENRGVRGVETYYLGPTDDPFLSQLAAAENRGSGYSLADLRTLLEQIYVGVRQDESRRLAGAVQESLLASLRTINPGVEDRGVKTAPFIVLMKTEMPAILAEVSCLSNEHEAELLAKPLYRQFLAEAVFAGIRAYSEALKNPEPKRIDS
jgi:N-acetylmuramoyl-L-alanine amidase